VIAVLAAPRVAEAHGPVAPVATSYLARLSNVPNGAHATIVDGYVRMWLQVAPTVTVEILDYRGAPYLRFAPSGVQVNRSSEMYYLNQTPFAQTPPAGLTPRTPPRWLAVSSGHDYEWHDGRLQALASVALTSARSYVGGWRIPLLINGRPAALSGTLWHADHPSIVWFWPIVVLLSCVLAAWRLRRPELDVRVARGLGATALIALGIAAIGRGLHGRPDLSVLQLAELAATLAFVAWGLRHLTLRRPGYFAYLMIAAFAIWEGLDLLPTLLNGFVLIALPAFLARSATVLCLATSAALLPLVFRLADLPHARSPRASRPATITHHANPENHDGS
jgi:hypothetical protein